MKVTLMVLTLNEIEGMRSVMPLIRREWVDEILVVDDSSDGTFEYAQQQGYRVIRQRSRGLVGAYRDGVAAAVGDVIIGFSPDGNSKPELIVPLIEKMKEGYDMVVASRYLDGARSEDDDAVTAFGNWMFTRLINLLFGSRYTDSLVMLRAWRKDLFGRVRFRVERAGLEPHLGILCAKAGLKVAEIPGDEPPRVGGVRKMSPVLNGTSILLTILIEFLAGRRAALMLPLLLLCPPARAQRKEVALVANAETLAEIESHGFTFGERLDGEPSRASSNSLLSKRPHYGAVVRVLEDDLRALAAEDGRLGTADDSAHRMFDAGWLRSGRARFQLIGVVNRLDRRPLDEGSCGEARLIYRLAYDAPVGRARRPTRWRGDPTLAYPAAKTDPDPQPGVPVRSRLPATANLIYRALDERGRADCAALARRWTAPAGLKGRTLGAWMISPAGPLAPALTPPSRLKGVEVNIAFSRWPSERRKDMGGNSENLLRFFAPTYSGTGLPPAALENTPDVPRLLADRALREELRSWIADARTLARVDEGTAVLPAKFLARRAVSASPFGLWRLANRPFRQVFSPQDFAGLKLSDRPRLRSPQGLLRRLDEMSCAGCHAGAGLAGFHLLGEDPAGAPPENALSVPLSPHLLADIPRRKAVVLSLASGRKPSYARPFSERADGGFGAHCGLGDPAFSAWRCGAGFSCLGFPGPDAAGLVGQCFPSGPGTLGGPCELGRIPQRADPGLDRAEDLGPLPCGKGLWCRPNAEGFPAGMCAQPCYALGKGGVCGAIQTMKDAAECGEPSQNYAVCLAEKSSPAGLRGCSAASPCRDDYACARTPAGPGACAPAWNLPQLRPDGHPRPQ